MHLTKLLTKYFKNVISKFLSFFAGVVDTADKHSFAIISANFLKKFLTIPMGCSEARGPSTYEKNLKSKFSCQTPCNGRSLPEFSKLIWINCGKISRYNLHRYSYFPKNIKITVTYLGHGQIFSVGSWNTGVSYVKKHFPSHCQLKLVKDMYTFALSIEWCWHQDH